MITLPRALAQLSLVAVLFALPCSIGCGDSADTPPAPAPTPGEPMMDTPEETPTGAADITTEE